MRCNNDKQKKYLGFAAIYFFAFRSIFIFNSYKQKAAPIKAPTFSSASINHITKTTGHRARSENQAINFLPKKYYVNNKHSSAADANPGTINLPWLTIQHAVENVSAGDTILVQSGNYAGARIEQSGTAEAKIILLAAESEAVVLDHPGSGAKHNSILELETWEGDGIVSNWVIDGFEIKNALRYGIDSRYANNIIIRNNHVYDSQVTGIFFAFCNDVETNNNRSHDNGEHGIYWSNSGDRPTISGNELWDNYGCGVHMNGDESMGGDGLISDAVVEKNIIYNNGRGGGSGINMDGVTSSIIRNNLLFNNHASGISLYKIDGAVSSRNNKILNNTVVMPSDGRWALNIADAECFNNQVFNNIFYSYHSTRGSIQIPTTNLSGFVCDYNILVNRLSTNSGSSTINLTAWQALGYDAHSKLASALQIFEAPTANNFSLKKCSPAINSGRNLSEVADDVAGDIRPCGGGFDIGAYESNYTPQVYYVSTTGNDGNDGLTPQTAWRTIQHAGDSAVPGDSVQILAGRYNGFTFNRSGTDVLPICFAGESRETVFIQGEIEFSKAVSYLNLSSISVQDFSGWGIFIRGKNKHIRLNDLHVSGGDCGIHLTWGYQAQDPLDGPVKNIIIENSLLENCVWSAIDGTPGPCDSITVRNVEVTGAGIAGQSSWGADGIAIERGQYITVENCFVHDNGGDGIDLCSRDFNGNAPGIVVRGNRVFRNRMTGIKVWSGGIIENNQLAGMGNAPVDIGAHPGIYEFVNNVVAFNMQNPDYAVRNYSFVAAYPDDETGVSAAMDLTMLNNIFAFNSSDEMGGPTGMYLGEGVNLVLEGYNCFFSRDDGEIQAEFVQGETWFSRERINNGEWASATGQGAGNITVNPHFADSLLFDLRLKSSSPCINAGHPAPAYNDVDGSRNDIGAFGGPGGSSYDYPGDNDHFLISGEVSYHTSEQPVNLVHFCLASVDTFFTDSNTIGLFSFQNISGNKNYELCPSKSGDFSSATIISYDASLAARLALGLLPEANQYQFIAADVDKNRAVQMYDAAMIARFAVDLPQMAGIFVGDWTFSPAQRLFQPLNANISNQDFTAIILGDVDGNWSDETNFAANELTNNPQLSYNPTENIFAVAFQNQGKEIYSYDLTLNFDPSKLTFARLQKTAMSQDFKFLFNDAQSGRLKIGGYCTAPLVETGEYLRILFNLTSASVDKITINLESFRINANPVQSGIFTDVQYQIDKTLPMTFHLFQNYPNPFNSLTRIKYQLPAASLVTLKIIDALGAIVKTLIQIQQEAGEYELLWNGQNNQGRAVASGIYFLQMDAGEFRSVKKIIGLN